MRKFSLVAVVVAVAAAALVSASLFPSAGDAAKRATAKVQVRVLRGPDMTLPPFTVSNVGDYDLRCPSGYVASGYGVLLGASELVYADPSSDGRGYDFAFANPSDTITSYPSASVICIRGTGAVRVIATGAAHSKAVRDAKAALR